MKTHLPAASLFCAGCPLELTLRVLSKVMGHETVIVVHLPARRRSFYGQNVGAWHRLPYYSCLMTGVASSATGLSRYYRKAGKDVNVVCFTGDGCAADIGFQTLSGAAERGERFIYICYETKAYMNTRYPTEQHYSIRGDHHYYTGRLRRQR